MTTLKGALASLLLVSVVQQLISSSMPCVGPLAIAGMYEHVANRDPRCCTPRQVSTQRYPQLPVTPDRVLASLGERAMR